MRIVYKDYRFVRRYFRYSFFVVNESGEPLRVLKTSNKRIAPEWKELTIDYLSNGELLNLILWSELKKREADPETQRMFSINIGLISISDIGKSDQETDSNYVDIKTIARHSGFEGHGLKKRELIDVYLEVGISSRKLKLAHLVITKTNGQFVYNIHFMKFWIRNLIFETDRNGCENFKVYVVTLKGEILENSTGLKICTDEVHSLNSVFKKNL